MMKHIFLTGHPSVGKTTIIQKVQANIRTMIPNIQLSGFYTQECRNNAGNRIGFDIVYHDCDQEEKDGDRNSGDNESANGNDAWKRVALSRMAHKIKKSDPAVGKYLVNIDNVDTYAVGSLSLDSATHTNKGLVLLDEVGKMEMLCPSFVPAVTKLLDATAPSDADHIVFGTIPTPRYGRVIDAVEQIRARENVLVLHVTKMNRDELPDLICQFIQEQFALLECESPDESILNQLEAFRYTRPLGASSMNGIGNSATPKTTTSESNSTPDEPGTTCRSEKSKQPKPCGPLVHKDVSPIILLLGETASPQPENDEYQHLAYCERSMWRIFGHMMKPIVDYRPIKDIENTSEESIQIYSDLKTQVLQSGICIWDVLSDVHIKGSGSGGTRSKRKRRSNSESTSTPNGIAAFLNQHPSIQMICFIGKKARSTFTRSFDETSIAGRQIECLTLPSSSPANARMTAEEKAMIWKENMKKHLSRPLR